MLAGACIHCGERLRLGKPSFAPPDHGGRAWTALAAVLALLALLGQLAPAAAIDWQPALAASQPWRAWTSAGLHYSGLHLGANLAGLCGVALLGTAGRLPWRSALAWAVAWPLSGFGLLLRPDLGHAGGLSGVLHAGVAVAAVHLLCTRHRRERLIGCALAIGLSAKVLAEAPWAAPLRYFPGVDIAVAPAMHASGLAAGLACALAAEVAARRRWLRETKQRHGAP